MMDDGNNDDDDDDDDDDNDDDGDGDGENESRGRPPIINPPWNLQFAVAFAIHQNSGIMSIIKPRACVPYVVSHRDSAPFSPAPRSYVLSETITPMLLSVLRRMRKAIAQGSNLQARILFSTCP